MSLISKQIDELRAYAKDRKGELAKLINDAADTIEMLSAKIQVVIEKEPGEDVKPAIHAHWIEFRGKSGNVHCKCSHCGKEVSYPYAKKRWKYCIECGAMMSEEEDE